MFIFVITILVSLLAFSSIFYLFRKLEAKKKVLARVSHENEQIKRQIIEIEELNQINFGEKKLLESELILKKEELNDLSNQGNRFKSLVEKCDGFLFEMDYKGQFKFANPALLNKLGYNQEELLLLNYTQLISPENMAEISGFYENQYKTKLRSSYKVLEVSNRFGEAVSISLLLRMDFNKEGLIELVQGFAQDLSIQSDVGKGKMVFTKGIDSLFQAFHLPVFILKKNKNEKKEIEHNLIWANQSFLNVCKLDWYEIQGISLKGLSLNLYQLVIEGSTDAIYVNESNIEQVFKIEIVNKDDLILVFLIDISKEKKEELKRESELVFFKQIFESSNFDIAVLNSEEKYVYINPSAVKDPAVNAWLIGKSDEDYAKLKHKNLNKLLSRKSKMDEVRLMGEPVRFEEFNLDGNLELSYYIRELSPIMDSVGNLNYLVGMGVNLTDRYRRIEAQMEVLDRLTFLFQKSEASVSYPSSELSKSTTSDVILKLAKSFRTIKGELLRNQFLGKAPGFYSYPMTLIDLNVVLQVNLPVWKGIDLRISLLDKDQSILMIPKCLLTELLNEISGFGTASPIKASIFIGSGEVQTKSLSLVLDFSGINYFEGSQLHYSLYFLIKMWQSEGFFANESDGFFTFSFPLIPFNNFSPEKQIKPILILKGKTVLLGPLIEKHVIWVEEELKFNGAKVVTVPSLASIDRMMEKTEFDLVIWWGKNLKELEQLPFETFLEKNIKMLFFQTDTNYKISNQILKSFVETKPFPSSSQELIEQVWLFSKSGTESKPVYAQENEIDLNFDKVLEITEGDKKFMARLFQTYIKSLEECLQNFSTHIEKSDSEGLRFLLHKIRATTKTFEIRSLEDVLKDSIEMTESGKKISLKQKDSLVKKVSRICKEVAAQIKEYSRKEKIGI